MERLALLLCLACTPSTASKGPNDSGTPPDDSGPDDDTGPTSPDEDGDGWTLAEGDCDDADIYVNPAWDEDTSDGKDNDCDGRTDERWTGLTVAWVNDDGASSLLTLDTLGNVADEVEIDSACWPYWIDRGLEGGAIINNAFGTVALVDASGACTDLADFSKTDYGVYGVATHPDGYYLATSLDALVRIDPGGSTEELARWNADFTDVEAFELAIYTVAVDLRDGTVGLFDYFGGFATWEASEGLVVHRRVDLATFGTSADDLYTYSGAARDGGGWVVAAVDMEGRYGLYTFDLEEGAWSPAATWIDEEWTPDVITLDGDSGDAYVTATAGWYATVWRVRAADGSLTNLYVTEGTEPDRPFTGIFANYE